MKFSKDISKAVTSVMALFQKQLCCSSNKATTICGQAAESLRRVPVRHNREGVATESKVQFVPPTMCRLTCCTFSCHYLCIYIVIHVFSSIPMNPHFLTVYFNFK